MKKIILSGLLAMTLAGSFSQIAFYDAIELAKYIDRDAEPVVFKSDSASLNGVSAILLKYCRDLSSPTEFQNVIAAITVDHPDNRDYNPILAPYLNIIIPQGAMGVSVESILTAAGGLDVTGFVDGLAKFLVERSKEELNVAFFKKFQEFFNDHPEVQVLFPTTSGFLKNIYSYQYAAILPALKAAFQKDLNNISGSFSDLGDIYEYPHYFESEQVKNRVDEIILLLQTPAGRSVLAAAAVSDGISKGNNIAEILNGMAENPFCTSYDDNLSNTIRFIELISNSLRSTGEERAWITRDQVKILIDDEAALDIYLGLLYSDDQKSNRPVHFNMNGNDISLKRILIDINQSWASARSLAFKQSFASLALTMSGVADDAQRLKASSRKDDGSSILVYADYASSISAYLKQAVNFLPDNSWIDPTLVNLAEELKTFTLVIDDATNICYDLKSQNYGALVLHSAALMDRLFGPGFTFKDDYIKYGIFMANIVEAGNSDEVNAAIEAAVLPVGSSSIKRETDFNISLNSFIGPFAGTEYLPKLKEDQWAFTAGLTAPVGVAFSWGNLGKGKIRQSGRETGGKSISLFLPLIDIGAMASFRMGNDSSEVASEVKLANIISPGLYLYYGFGKCPVSVGLGGQLGPQLREVTAENVNIDKNFYFRYGINIVVDIPMFNLYTKN
jgi:hypothetical protein